MGDGYVPGELHLRRDNEVSVMPRTPDRAPSVQEFLGRMERSNSHGAITPAELVAVTPEGHVVFGQPYVAGRRVTTLALSVSGSR